MCLRVAVVGGGAAGLCAARHLSASGAALPTVFEMTDRVGGTWVYSEAVGTDKRGQPIHSSMYENLRTNLPKEVMAFPDFPFLPSHGQQEQQQQHREESFIHHSRVLAYLEDYANHFNLQQYIQFDTKIESVSFVDRDGEQQGWEVVSRCLETNSQTKELFDGVVICSGHYSVPAWPSIQGLEMFRGTVLHSHDYRHEDSFRNKSVVILGAAASGTDLAMELAPVAGHVYLSHNGPELPTRLPKNVTQVKGITTCLGAEQFGLKDGETLETDALILATGYEYSFPFLTTSCGVKVTSRRVAPLYKHLLNINHPTMAFIGLPYLVCPFPMFDLQVQFYVKSLLGLVELPSREAMLADTQQEAAWRREQLAFPDKYFHKMGDLQWDYNRELVRLGQLDPLPPVIEALYQEVHQRRRENLPGYKRDVFRLLDREHFCSLEPTHS